MRLLHSLRWLVFAILLCAPLFGQVPSQPKSPATPSHSLAAPVATIESSDLRIEFDGKLHTQVIARFGGRDVPLGPFSASETITAEKNQIWKDFAFVSQSRDRVADGFGKGERLLVSGTSGSLAKSVSVVIYDDFPAIALFDVTYTNRGSTPIEIRNWTNNSYSINAQPKAGEPAFWSYQSGSYEKRPNWVLPLHPGFTQDNYLGMNASDYGGGTPIVDVWRRDVGIGVGHVEPGPRLVSLPVAMPDARHAHMAVVYKHAKTLAPS